MEGGGREEREGWEWRECVRGRGYIYNYVY
jgi:hypothetical protein